MLGLPQSTIVTNVQVLEDAELIATEISKASKGQQKICSARFDEIIIRLDWEETNRKKNVIDVEMPLRLYTSCDVSAPCDMCSGESIIGMLDVPDLFFDPSRVHAALIWFDCGYVEYKFPNNAKVLKAEVGRWSSCSNCRPKPRARTSSDPPTSRFGSTTSRSGREPLLETTATEEERTPASARPFGSLS
jgi:predicted transcriptional regulator